MALSGIVIYKMLPQTNCKDCGFPTCLAFAMKLAAKQVELSACPHVSEESKAKLSESAAPPIRLVTLSSNGAEVKAGNFQPRLVHHSTDAAAQARAGMRGYFHVLGFNVNIHSQNPVSE